MARSSNPEDPENQAEEAEQKFVQEEGFQLGWGGMTQALGLDAAEKKMHEEIGD